MTDHRNQRVGLYYWVWALESHATPPTLISVYHGREHDVLEALIRAAATGCNVSPKYVPYMGSYVSLLRNRGVQIATTYPPARRVKSPIIPGYSLVSKVARATEGGAQ